jgi:hypothetical protein
LVKGALKIMAWTKAKTAVVAGMVLILAAGTTTVIVENHSHHAPVKSEWTPAEVEAFHQETSARMSQSKLWGLACIMFADDHGNKMADNFEQLKTYGGGTVDGKEISLSSSNLELVSGGSLTAIAKPPQTILLREIKSRPSPDGGFVKVYTFTDGHCELASSPDDDFAALEKQRGLLVQPAKN